MLNSLSLATFLYSTLFLCIPLYIIHVSYGLVEGCCNKGRKKKTTKLKGGIGSLFDRCVNAIAAAAILPVGRVSFYPDQVLWPKLFACRTFWLSLYQSFAQVPTHQYMYTILKRKAPNSAQIGFFLLKIHPNLCNLGSFISDENPPITLPNFAKIAFQKAGILYVYIPCQCETPQEFLFIQIVSAQGIYPATTCMCTRHHI